LLIVLCLIVVQCFNQCLSLDLLNPPQQIKGTVWEDWNGDGLRQAYEPGFAYATVRLIFQSTPDTNFLLNTEESYTIDPVSLFTLSDGQYYFDCLTPGNYSIQVELPDSRPSTFSTPLAGNDTTSDSDITIINGNIGTTPSFLAISGNAITIDAGVHQYGFMNLFPMTGRENVPTEPDTVLGSTYSVYDSRKNTLYYRVERGPWKQYNFEDLAGFFQGFPGQTGNMVRSLADRSAVKTNLWVVPSNIIPLFYAGQVYVEMHANGSFSDDGRLRGNWNPFYNRKNVITTLTLLGENIVPTPVSTAATGSLQITFNFDSNVMSYQLDLSGFGRAQVKSIGLYGPANVNSVGSALGIELSEGNHVANISSSPHFAENFFSNKLYVLVTSDQFPQGHIRAQISGFSQVVYYSNSVFSFEQVEPFYKLAFALDTVKHTLTYYITIEAPQSEFTQIIFLSFDRIIRLNSDYWKSGLWVYQGFLWNLSPSDEENILGGVVLDIIAGNQFDSVFTGNWF